MRKSLWDVWGISWAPKTWLLTNWVQMWCFLKVWIDSDRKNRFGLAYQRMLIHLSKMRWLSNLDYLWDFRLRWGLSRLCQVQEKRRGKTQERIWKKRNGKRTWYDSWKNKKDCQQILLLWQVWLLRIYWQLCGQYQKII